MAIDDLSHDPAGPVPPSGGPPARTSATRWILVIVAAMAAGAFLTFSWMSRTQSSPVAPAPTAATDVPTGANRPDRQPLNLPGLDGADTFLADLVSALSRHPMIARLVATPDLVRSVALAVVQIGDGKTPASPLAVLQPSGRLQVIGAPTGTLNPASYDRWNVATAALVSIDAAAAAQLYVNVKPLFDEAVVELGQPGGDFDLAIVTAILTLAATPDISDEPVLLSRPGYFEHEDAALRALLPVQKQFLLIGPDNRRQIMDWLRQLATNLDLGID
jgi:hypothetical protein